MPKFKRHSFKVSVLTMTLFLLILVACGGSETPERPETQPEESLATPQEATAQPQTQAESGQASAEETEIASPEEANGSQTPTAAPAVTSTGLFLFSAAQVPGDQESRDIFTIDTQGQNLRNLTNTPGQDIAPNWSPDGSQIIWVSERDNNLEIYAMNLDSSNLRRLTQADGTDTSPTWSPDGQRIAFSSERDGNREIYLMEADGANPRNLSHNEALEDSPSWSPDGTRLLFVSDRSGNRDIYVMNADGGNVVPLTDDPADDEDPRWSPDGDQIVFISTRDGNQELYLMSADGSNLRRLTDDLPDDSGPVWSPDGQTIIWRSKRTGQTESYVMDAGGGNYRHLSYIPAEASTPRVQPQAAAQITFAGEPVELQTSYIDLSPFVLSINIGDTTIREDNQEYKGASIDIVLDPDRIRLPEGEQTDEDNFIIAQLEYISIFSVLRTSPYDENPTLHIAARAELPAGAILNIFPGEIELIDTGESPAFFLNLPDSVPVASNQPEPDLASAIDLAPFINRLNVDFESWDDLGMESYIGLSIDGSQVQGVNQEPDNFPTSHDVTKFSVINAESISVVTVETSLEESQNILSMDVWFDQDIPDTVVLYIAEGELEAVLPDGQITRGPFVVQVTNTTSDPQVVTITDPATLTSAGNPSTTTGDTGSAEPAQSPLLSVETYLTTALPKALEITVAVDQVTKMLRNPQADRLAWVAAMEPHANAAQAGYEALAALNPPPAFQQVHTTLLEGANACAQGTGQIVTGIKGPDQAALDASGPLIKSCTEKVIQAVQLIQQALTEQPAASVEGAEGNAAPASGDLPLFPILSGGKWGFINKAGQVVIEPQFGDVHRFSFPTFAEGLEPVRVGEYPDGQWGYIDQTGQFVIGPQYEYAVQFSEGLSNFVIDDKTGYMRPDGTVIIEPVVTDNSFPFQEGMANFNINGKWGYYDTTGAIAIQPQFDEAWAFYEGLAAVRVGSKWGYIDKTGQFVIEPQFDKFKNFSDGLAAVESGGQVKFIDASGQVVLDSPIPGATYFSFSEGLAAVRIDEKYGFIDKTGKIVIEPQFDKAGSFSEGLVGVELGGGYRYIDTSGQMVFQLEFDFPVDPNRAVILGDFYEGLAMVKVNGKFGYVDKTGNFVWEPAE